MKESLHQEIARQNENRLLWQENDTPEGLVAMLAAEVAELAESVQTAYITGDVFSVASEVGDVRYLLERFCNATGIDSEQAARMKVTRNSMKYPDAIMSDGRDYPTAAAVCREGWRLLGGDAVWSHAYLELLADD